MESVINENKYKVRTSSFEGPFSVLLSLVEEKKLHINDLSLAQVTEDFIRHISTVDKADNTEVSSFMIVASTLILIKSKSLLPNLPLSEDEEKDINNLTNRLKLYEIYTNLGEDIRKKFGKSIIFSPLEKRQESVVFLPDSQITKESMMILIDGALGRMPKKEFLPKIEVKKVISIEEMIYNLTERIKKSVTISFKELNGKIVTKEEKINAIVSFLAMLELVREGILSVLQENNFQDIIIQKTNNL
ncbi:MAG: ScpA family protein [Candidatus Paceibacterota bacterium]|jgi:segregation and condensation protein A